MSIEFGVLSNMAKASVKIFPTLEELSWAAAARFEDLARICAIEKRNFCVALSGGLTPRLLYQILGSETFAGRIRWDNVHIFEVDERAVPPENPQSNFGMIRETLLSHISIPEENVHRMAGEAENLDEVCRQYSAELVRVLKPAKDEFPRLGLVILGMGPDGHTASLFPGSEALEEKVLWVRPNYIDKLKMKRLTLTFPILNAAEEVLLLVAGADKAETVRKVLEGPPGQFPVQRVDPVNGRMSWFLDEAAARLLNSPPKG
jgi:6-phosphogluconolactonase